MYEYNVQPLRVVDGDTVDVMVDLGFDVWVKKRLRLIGIDAPETRTRDLEEKRLGYLAKEEVIRLLTEAEENEQRIWIKSHEVGKYGRPLSTIYIDDLDVNQYLLDEGFAELYE